MISPASANAWAATTVTTEIALAWAKASPDARASYWANRLSVVRVFATYLRAIDVLAEVPPVGLIPDRNRRATPFLYSDEEIAALMAESRGLASRLVSATYETLIGLLSVTGLRIGEAIRLDRKDVAEDLQLLRIHDSKFHKSREVPLHPSSVAALRAYADLRDELCPVTTAPSFFVSARGHRLCCRGVEATFAKLVCRACLEPRSERCRPRLHDLRHTFAVRTLLGWYRSEVSVEPRLQLLSTFLGHINPQKTYWYLSATPELFAFVGSRLEEFTGELP